MVSALSQSLTTRDSLNLSYLALRSNIDASRVQSLYRPLSGKIITLQHYRVLHIRPCKIAHAAPLLKSMMTLRLTTIGKTAIVLRINKFAVWGTGLVADAVQMTRLSRLQMPVSASIYNQDSALYTKKLVSYPRCCLPFHWAISSLFQSDFSLVFPLPSLREPSNKIDQTNEDWNLDQWAYCTG